MTALPYFDEIDPSTIDVLLTPNHPLLLGPCCLSTLLGQDDIQGARVHDPCHKGHLQATPFRLCQSQHSSWIRSSWRICCLTSKTFFVPWIKLRYLISLNGFKLPI
uniref:Uncharacterized protein n=1 Tax=Oryza barthii TaxID=65489 RepID=A0A0D3HUI4_9ORYZ